MIFEALPDDLQKLFRGPEGGEGRGLSVALPTGRLVLPDEGEGETPVLWLSDRPATADLYRALRAEHARSGLYPLLLDALDKADPDYRPWACGELFLDRLTSPDSHDPAAVLAGWWPDDGDEDEERTEATAPFGQGWPGLAPAAPPRHDPDLLAEAFAHQLLAEEPHVRLGLVAAPTGAAALTSVGWSGPLNHDNDTARFSAVVGDWERRFGVRVVGVGFDTLRLSVAAPPATADAALAVAAEHLAFCPDNIWQGVGSVADYAEMLVDEDEWYFWWD
ncbi:DUF4253 domain-containing protein [Streptomyces sp. NPDC020917]|uniref:DUF4253 domain-containing protein n=1 Tax=Streptomyces sp. NPDC020917 TaxID=3365102 RepID=UPI0037B47863